MPKSIKTQRKVRNTPRTQPWLGYNVRVGLHVDQSDFSSAHYSHLTPRAGRRLSSTMGSSMSGVLKDLRRICTGMSRAISIVND